MSVIDICGLPGDSTHSSFVFGVIAASNSSTLVLSASVTVTPAD
jgi:hypothetical protein